MRLSDERRRLLDAMLRRRGIAADRTPRVRPRDPEVPVPLSFAQQRLWFLERLQPGVATYNVPGALRLRGPLDTEALRRAMASVVDRHEALRTSFQPTDSDPVQVVHPHVPVRLETATVTPQRLTDRLRELAAMPFDLTSAPLLRTELLRLEPDDHVLFCCLHHIVADGWSIPILFDEIASAYRAHLAGVEPDLEPLGVQYPDYALWQRTEQAAEIDSQAEWWIHQLATAPELFDMPTDRPRPPAQTFAGAAHLFSIPADVSTRLRELASTMGATPFMVLLSMWGLVLSRWSALTEIVVGTPTAGRTRPEIEPLIGFFVNTLPLRLDLSGNPTVRELVARVRETALGAFAHQDVPFERLVSEVAVGRDLSHAPVFQVMFVLQNLPDAHLDLEGLTVEGMPLDAGVAKFDLTLEVFDSPHDLDCRLEYATDLFDSDTVSRIAEHVLEVCRSFAASPDSRVTDIRLPGAEGLGAGRSHPMPTASVPELVAEVAARQPDAVAVADDSTTLTYRELDEQANRFAHHLSALGVGPSDVVGVSLPRRADAVWALLGVMRAGAAYLPIDPDHPQARRDLIVGESGARVVVSELDVEAIASRPSTPPGVQVHPEGLAYVMFTSGTTGTPKGIGVPHRAVVRLVSDPDLWSVGPGDVAAQTISLSFDPSVMEIWATLCRGATLRLLDRDTVLSTSALAEAIRSHGIDALTLPAAVFGQVASEDPATFRGLRELHVGGEILDPQRARDVIGHVDGLVNAYGPTECATVSTAYVVREPVDGPVPIGGPVANTVVRVLDRHGNPCPPGVRGELHVAGPHLARGYVGRPDLTAERFVPDPWGPPGSRLYATGDVVRWRADGTLHFEGRTDTQVKVRGFRVELGEVESVIGSHPQVRACAAVARDGLLVAYVVTGASPEELRAWTADRLPAYMVPSILVPLDSLPLDPNGKVDRRALPEPSQRPLGDGRVPPSTPTELRLAAIWRDVLGTDGFGAADDFFTIGGHSLLAAQVAGRVAAATGVDLPLRAIFEAPTIASLARRIDSTTAGPREPIPPADVDRDLVPSYQQQRLWFLDRLEPGNPAYNLPGALRLRGPLDADALADAVATVVARHDSLRTTLDEVDGAPVLRVHPPQRFSLRTREVSSAEEMARRIDEIGGRPFDLAAGPLIRLEVLRLSPDDHALAVCMHHSISDGWSVAIFFDELAACYAAAVAGEPPQLRDLEVTYADYAAWQRSGDRNRLDRQLAWWTGQLAGAPPRLELPTDRPRPAVQSHRGATVSRTAGAETAKAVEVLGASTNSTAFMVLLAAFSALCGRWAGSSDVVVGTPIAGRSRPDLEPIIGFFVNTLALRTRLDGDPSALELVGRVRETVLGAFANQDLPFERLVEVLQPQRDLGHTPLFQVMLNMVNVPMPTGELPGVEVEPILPGEVGSKFDLTLYAQQAAGDLHLTLVYNPDLFDADRMAELLDQLELLLGQMASSPGTPVAELALVTDGARALVPDAAAPLDSAWTGPVWAEIDSRCADDPDAVAVGDMTRAWLRDASGRWAASLRDAGVGPSDVVAVWAARTPELVAALLGIWKAGAAFTIIDPAHPVPRLLACAEAARPAAWLSVAGDPPPEVAASCGVEVGVGEGSFAIDPHGVGPDDVAYVAFTSGSTGRPVGVVGRHGPLANHAAWWRRSFEVTGRDRVTMLSGLAHDPLLRDIFAPLAAGAAVCVPEGESFAAWMRERQVTISNLTPATVQMICSGAGEVTVPSLRLAFVVGDVLTAAHVTALRRLAPSVRVVNLFGATETQQALGVWDATGLEAWGARTANGMDGVQLLVLTPGGAPTGVGELGEIVFRSPHLAARALDPNADRFGELAGCRTWRSGDLGRLCTDGSISVSGRSDDQVQVRGFRVEPGEVAAVISAHLSVSDAAVALRDDAPGGRGLVAYWVGDASTEELREWCTARLPAWMVPSAFVGVERIPLTPAGKLDRTALPPPVADFAPEHVEADTPTERTLARIWSEVLGHARVGATDDFFMLGGHSLLATQVVGRVASTMGARLELRAVFEHPRLRDLAACVDDAPRTVAAPIPVADRSGDLPLSYAQERLWFLWSLEPDEVSYNLTGAVELEGELEVDAIRRAVALVVQRHGSLRTSFHAPGGAGVQRVEPDVEVDVPVVEAGPDEVPGLLDSWAAEPYDLRRTPLWRVRLIRSDPVRHVLFICMHHIISDGWSLALFVSELADAYRAFAAGVEPDLPTLDVSYADYAVWQRRALAPELGRQRDFWLRTLESAPDLLPLPTDRPRPPVQTSAGSTLRFDFDAALAGRVTELANALGATPFMVLLAAFDLVLSRWSGSTDVVVGSPIAGRNRPDLENLIGFFVNSLPMRVDLSGDPTVSELVDRVRSSALAAYAHSDLPFSKLVEELQPKRDPSHPPVFQVMFALQNTPVAASALSGLAMRPLEVGVAASSFDLTARLAETPDGIVGWLDHNTDLFDRDTIARFATHLRNVVEAMVADPSSPLSAIDVMDPEERRAVVGDHNLTGRPLPEAALGDLLRAQAARTPEAAAVADARCSLTYRELDESSDRLARALVAAGVEVGEPVAVTLPRSTDLIVAVCAIVKAGAAYLPLDPDYPRARLELMLADAGARFGLGEVDVGSLTLVDIDADAPADPPVRVAGDDVAYVNYTSGSTGTPKGIAVPHRAVVRLVCNTDYLDLAPGDVVAQASTASFDAFTFEVWGALLSGATVRVVDRDDLLDPRRLRDVLERTGVTTMFVTTALFNRIADDDPALLSGVRDVLFGGEAVDAARVRRVLEAGPPARLLHVYGPTETTTFATWHPVVSAPRDTVPIGKPIANTTVYVLDPHGNPCPVGVAGQIAIGGPGVALGYVDRPDLTAERFVPDPFSDRPGSRLYRTGDLGRRLPDGAIVFAGRTDDQVKIRGFRIEPGEVASVLSGHPEVGDVVVVVRDDAPGGRGIVAYHTGRPDPGALRAWLAERLPDHMLPAAFVATESIPLNPHGKVDRAALPAPDPASADRHYEPPVTATQRALARIWGDVLGAGRVGLHDDFFALGGHSLIATQVTSRIASTLGAEVPLRAVFEHPTVAGLAEVVESSPRAQTAAIQPVPRDDEIPLSFGQERMWFLDQLDPGSATYNVPIAIRLTGRVDADALAEAMRTIVSRHETLRTTYARGSSGLVQRIAADVELPLRVHTTQGLRADRERKVRDIAERLAREGFDLAQGPLWRAALVWVGPSEAVLALCFHHIAVDGWSMGLLLRELLETYEAITSGRRPRLPELDIGYPDYAAWQREWLSGPQLRDQLDWWTSALDGAPPFLELPTDRPRPPVRPAEGAAHGFRVDAETSRTLSAEAARRGATPFMLLLAAFATFLHRHTGATDLVVGTPVSGRTRAEVEDLIGFFVNTLTLRLDLGGDPTFDDVVERTKQACLAAFAHADVPFERLVNEIKPPRDLSHTPVFQVMFSVQNPPLPPDGAGGIGVELESVDPGVAKFDLTLDMLETPDGFLAGFTYSTALFTAETVRRFAERFTELLRSVAADPSVRISECRILPDDERRLLLEVPQSLPIPGELVSSIRSRTPDAVAVRFGDAALTYADVDERANRLAHRLRELGAGPDRVVAVCLTRGPDMVTAPLAVLRAGAAYLPIDASYPPERIAFMISDSEAVAVVSDVALEGLDTIAPDEVSLASYPAEAPPLDVRPDNLAYVIYTSGTTGRPKAVALEHRHLAYSFACTTHRPARAGEATLSTASFSFDVFTGDWTHALAVGATLVIATPDELLDPSLLATTAETHRVVHCDSVPAIWRALSGHAERTGTRLSHPAHAVSGGDALAGADLVRMRRAFDDEVGLTNAYGVSEAAIDSTWVDLDDSTPTDGPLPIGAPNPNTGCYVLDDHLEPVPVGVFGELYIGGDGVARGYLRRPALTAERFLPDPFSGVPGSRMYRTGDRVRWLPGGLLGFAGRTDDQVKIRGFRIEPGEVESVLGDHPAVVASAVVASGDGETRRLVAWVVGDAQPSELRAWCAERLPDHMVPAVVAFTDRLPLTPNGKIDRPALSARPTAVADLSRIEPRTPTERAVAEAWGKVLGVSPAAGDHFFELGGHSLLAAEAVEAIRDAVGVAVPLRAIFEQPTVETLAAAIDRMRGEQP